MEEGEATKSEGLLMGLGAATSMPAAQLLRSPLCTGSAGEEMLHRAVFDLVSEGQWRHERKGPRRGPRMLLHGRWMHRPESAGQPAAEVARHLAESGLLRAKIGPCSAKVH